MRERKDVLYLERETHRITHRSTTSKWEHLEVYIAKIRDGPGLGFCNELDLNLYNIRLNQARLPLTKLQDYYNIITRLVDTIMIVTSISNNLPLRGDH